MTELVEDYCSYEVVKLLKEKGFPEGLGTWNVGFVKTPDGFIDGLVKHHQSIPHALAMKWLREKGVYIVINPWLTTLKPVSYWYSITTREHYSEQEDFTTYEAAVEAALIYSLENLI